MILINMQQRQSSVRDHPPTHLEIDSEDSDASHDHDTRAEIRDEVHGRQRQAVATPLFLGRFSLIRLRSVACLASLQLRAP